MLYICMTESEFVRVEMIVYLFLLYQVKECDKLSSQSIYFCFGVNSSLVRTEWKNNLLVEYIARLMKYVGQFVGLFVYLFLYMYIYLLAHSRQQFFIYDSHVFL